MILSIAVNEEIGFATEIQSHAQIVFPARLWHLNLNGFHCRLTPRANWRPTSTTRFDVYRFGGGCTVLITVRAAIWVTWIAPRFLLADG